MPGDYGPGGKWIHDRAHGIMEDGDTPKDVAYAIATQQAHKVGKSPKDFRTPEGVREAKQKYDEPKSEYQKTAGIEESIATAGPIIGGLTMGTAMGRGVAGHTAAGLAPRGRKTRSEDIARRIGWIGAPAGAIGAMALGHKMGWGDALARALARAHPTGLIGNPAVEQAILRGALPVALGMGGGALGGALTGLGVGGVQRLRGSPYMSEQEAPMMEPKEAMLRGLFDELDKIAQSASSLNIPGGLSASDVPSGNPGLSGSPTAGMMGAAAPAPPPPAAPPAAAMASGRMAASNQAAGTVGSQTAIGNATSLNAKDLGI